MAYRFKLDEPVEIGFRRIGVEQIDRALGELRSDGDPGKAVHSARKSIKRLRALLRLVRPALGDAAFAKENAWFRDAAALLSGARDAEILLETATKLAARDDRGDKGSTHKLATLLAASVAQADRTGENAARAEATQRLVTARARFMRLRLSPDTFDAIQLGLERSLCHTRTAFDRAYSEPTDEAFHEWRKGVQRHWRHMALLNRAWPELAEARVAQARVLSQILGDDHDLAVLKLHLTATPPNGLTRTDCRDIAKRADKRQAELRLLARPTGERLLAEGARGLARRFAVYWEAAQAVRTADMASDEVADE